MDMGHSEIADIYRDLAVTPPLLRWDVFPKQYAPVYTAESLLPQFVKWGFDSPYGKEQVINARAETVTEKPFFSKDFSRQRCVVPCSGFYEWDGDKNQRLFADEKGNALYMAGFCKRQDGLRFIILTKSATPPVNSVHHRIPVLLNKSSLERYLQDENFARKSLSTDCINHLVLLQP